MKTKVYMEHANITVQNIDESVKFFKTAFPEFKVRGGGDGWLHLGDNETYLALTLGEQGSRKHPDYHEFGINHIGFVVDDVESVAIRLEKEGYLRSYPKQVQQYRIRDYFNDSDNNQYEFVQYLSDNFEERNTYSDQ
jgi:catechol 2,3-dioxygenase-like lactoylglutathione lyase family enzyme